MELKLRDAENGYIVEDEDGREFVWHEWRTCEQSMRRHFEPNREAITGEVGVEFPAERTRQIIESTKSMKAAQE